MCCAHEDETGADECASVDFEELIKVLHLVMFRRQTLGHWIYSAMH